MQKTILITGSTDGIGLATARMLVSKGHHVLLHGRNPAKLESAKSQLSGLSGDARIETYVSDLSLISNVEKLAQEVAERHTKLDVLINNAGIFRVADSITHDGLDVRFAVNTIAPCLLTQRLLPLLGSGARVVNVSSAGQAPVDLQALAGRVLLSDEYVAYAQSKLALTMWSRSMALSLENKGLVFIAINPGSLLGSKMVKEGFGVAGGDISIGANILTRAALSDDFAAASGQYFDNDCESFAPPHPDALNARKLEDVMYAIEAVIAEKSQ